MTEKQFKLTDDDIQELVKDPLGGFASDRILVEGEPVGFMFREEPVSETDSGWRFLSGTETADELDDVEFIGFYSLNLIANYDPRIVPFLDAEVGLGFASSAEGFVEVEIDGPEEDADG